MPLTKRAVSPVNVSRGAIPASIQRDELQCVSNGTLVNLIRQLGSLSKHAENVFGEIFHDAMKIHHKTSTLEQRVGRLHAKVSQLNADTEQISLKDANMRKPFKSSMLVDQHILERTTFPVALCERYIQCNAPPNLDALNPYRESAEPALTLYTDPSFFFNLWKRETLKDVAERPRRVKSPNEGSRSPKKKRNRPPPQPDELPRQVGNRLITPLRQQPNTVFSLPDEYQAPQALGLQLNRSNQQHHHQPMGMPMMNPFGMSMSQQAQQHHGYQQHADHRGPAPHRQMHSQNRQSPQKDKPFDFPLPDMSILAMDDDDDDLPPPPALLMHSSIVHQLPSEMPTSLQFVQPSAETPNAPPPPPPPPPPMPTMPSAATFASSAKNDGQAAAAIPDARGDLLAQIQSGIKLKKVRLAEEAAAEKAAEERNDVAAILKRRMEHVLGNDEDDSSEDGGDDDEWD